LGDLIAKVTGLTFEEAIRKNLFFPLGMSNSTFLLAEVPSAKRVAPHERHFENVLGTIYPYNRAHAPSSTLHSCAEDMCKWMLVNLNRGEYAGQRILQSESYNQLWKEWFPSDHGQSVGLSWFVGKHRNLKTVEHGGLVYGFRTQQTMIPEKRIGVTMMSNINPAPMVELTNGILDILLGYLPSKPLKPVLFMVANAYHKVGYQAALDILNDCKEDEGEYDFAAMPFIKLGDSLWDSGESDQAIDILNLGLVLDPSSAGIHAMLAYMYHNLGEHENAQESFEMALALDPEDAVVKYVGSLLS
jgi:CubicO group peptidase (beta-lactamase class C family)